MIYWAGFLLSTSVVLYAGTGLSKDADLIATRFGLGRTWVGFVILAGVTSLPELFSGVSAAASGFADIAVGGVLGSCAFNLLIFVLLDVMYRLAPGPGPLQDRKGHAVSAWLGILLIAVAGGGILFGTRLPSLGWVGLYSLLFIIIYLGAMRFMYHYRQRGEQTLSFKDGPGPGGGPGNALLLGRFSFHAALIVGAAIFLPVTAKAIADTTGMGDTFAGNVLVAVATSLPEIATCVAAFRLGAVDLAIGNIFGSNVFNILVLAVDDLLYAPGPILSVVEPTHLVPALAAIVMTLAAVAGLYGRGRFLGLPISRSSVVIAAVFGANILALYLMR